MYANQTQDTVLSILYALSYFIQQPIIITFANHVNLLTYYYPPSLLMIEMKQREVACPSSVSNRTFSRYTIQLYPIWSLKSVGIFPKQCSLLSTLLPIAQFLF